MDSSTLARVGGGQVPRMIQGSRYLASSLHPSCTQLSSTYSCNLPWVTILFVLTLVCTTQSLSRATSPQTGRPQFRRFDYRPLPAKSHLPRRRVSTRLTLPASGRHMEHEAMNPESFSPMYWASSPIESCRPAFMTLQPRQTRPERKG